MCLTRRYRSSIGSIAPPRTLTTGVDVPVSVRVPTSFWRVSSLPTGRSPSTSTRVLFVRIPYPSARRTPWNGYRWWRRLTVLTSRRRLALLLGLQIYGSKKLNSQRERNSLLVHRCRQRNGSEPPSHFPGTKFSINHANTNLWLFLQGCHPIATLHAPSGM